MPLINEEFRRSMHWFHTWFGITLGAILFVVFWAGSLAVFDKEIHQWMIPETRIASVSADFSFDSLFQAFDDQVGNARSINMRPPTDRRPVLLVQYQDLEGNEKEAFFDPNNYRLINVTQSRAGNFFYDFHYTLEVGWRGIGGWIVAFAALSMMMLMISGIYVHRKIITDFFTFRPKKNTRRSVLDLHNVTAVLGLPFYFMLCLSGILSMITVYFSWSHKAPYDGNNRERLGDLGIPIIVPATGNEEHHLSIDAMLSRIESRWTGNQESPAKVDRVAVDYPGDQSAVVMWRSTTPADRITANNYLTYTDAGTGEVVSELQYGGAQAVKKWLLGAHFIQFDHITLRWLYFFAGLGGCVMIASGMVFWMQSRIKKTGMEPRKVGLVRAMTVGATTGIILSTGSYFLANRLLAKDLSAGGLDRAELEVLAFFCVWFCSFIHALLRGKKAWFEQCAAISAASLGLVVLNWLTTGDHIAKTLGEGLWGVAGMDLVVLAAAVCGIWACYCLKKASASSGDSSLPGSRPGLGSTTAE